MIVNDDGLPVVVDDRSMPVTSIRPTHPSFIDSIEAAALLRAVQAGQPGAMDRLIEVCQPLVRLHAGRWAARRSDVDDIVQDVWERLVVNASQIRNPDVLVGWLVTVTRRTALGIGRRAARSLAAEFVDEPALDDVDEEAMQRCSRDETVACLGDALGRLSEADRRLLLLLHRDRRPSYDDVSRMVSRPVGSLGPTRLRLLRRLRIDPSVERLRVVC